MTGEPFICKKCGATGEHSFSWDGQCLVCEENDMQGDFSAYERMITCPDLTRLLSAALSSHFHPVETYGARD